MLLLLDRVAVRAARRHPGPRGEGQRQGLGRAPAGQSAESPEPLSPLSGVSGKGRRRKGEGILRQGRELQFAAADQLRVHPNEGQSRGWIEEESRSESLITGRSH